MRLASIEAMIVLGIVTNWGARGYTQSQPPFMDFGRVTHQSDLVTLSTSDPRPMAQAVVASRQEFGWLLDYEDPIYEPTEMIDGRTADFLVQHPNSHRFLRPNGTSFNHTFTFDPINHAEDGFSDERRYTDELIAAYSQTTNPGRFVAIVTGPQRLAVVGIDSYKHSLMDTKLSIVFNSATGYEALSQTLHMLGGVSGHRVGLGFVTPSPLMHCTVTTSCSDIKARQILLDLFSACGQTITYQFLYDINHDTYLFNADGAVLAITDTNGRRFLRPLYMPSKEKGTQK